MAPEQQHFPCYVHWMCANRNVLPKLRGPSVSCRPCRSSDIGTGLASCLFWAPAALAGIDPYIILSNWAGPTGDFGKLWVGLSIA
jgi:hypothetical protein